MHLWWFYNVSVTHLHKFVQVELPCKVLAWQQNRVGVLFPASEGQN